MKGPASHVRKISTALDEWGSSNKLIIGIEGYSGSGKTTILKELAKRRPDVVTVHLDHFLAPRKERESLAREPLTYKPDWREAKWYRYGALDELVDRFLETDTAYSTTLYESRTGDWTKEVTFDFSKRILAIEGIMLFRSPVADKLDKLVFLDAKREASDRRRQERLSRKTRKAVGGSAQVWADKFHRLYSEHLRQESPDSKADLVIRID